MSYEDLLYKLRSMGISGELCNFLRNYLQVDFKGLFKMEKRRRGNQLQQEFPRVQYLVIFFFLVCISDLPNELRSSAKLFAAGASLFTIVKDKNESANILSNDLLVISKWASNWKMLFNPDPSTPAQEVLFSGRFKFVQPDV